ncbi:hypothetical protein CIB48_g5645 [Xylaria polymorpha]|nr:hypothetical protein CIB48_g5645 [Xylaria polymorpha]
MTDTPLAQDTQPQLHLFSRVYEGASIVTAQSLAMGMKWAREWYQWFYPPSLKPNFVKIYECRPQLPISIFFPRGYDQTLPQALPTVFIIHGGGFCMGSPEDDDVWSERFATMHNVLVIELNYRKAPAHPFPTATYDIEALMLAVFNDESLPLDKSRIAVVDQTIHTKEKLKMRYYKPDLNPGTRGKSSDLLAGWGQTFRWSYIPIGHDLRDPLLSPYFALRDDLPPHVFLIGPN